MISVKYKMKNMQQHGGMMNTCKKENMIVRKNTWEQTIINDNICRMIILHRSEE